ADDLDFDSTGADQVDRAQVLFARRWLEGIRDEARLNSAAGPEDVQAGQPATGDDAVECEDRRAVRGRELEAMRPGVVEPGGDWPASPKDDRLDRLDAVPDVVPHKLLAVDEEVVAGVVLRIG